MFRPTQCVHATFSYHSKGWSEKLYSEKRLVKLQVGWLILQMSIKLIAILASNRYGIPNKELLVILDNNIWLNGIGLLT